MNVPVSWRAESEICMACSRSGKSRPRAPVSDRPKMLVNTLFTVSTRAPAASGSTMTTPSLTASNRAARPCCTRSRCCCKIWRHGADAEKFADRLETLQFMPGERMPLTTTDHQHTELTLPGVQGQQCHRPDAFGADNQAQKRVQLTDKFADIVGEHQGFPLVEPLQIFRVVPEIEFRAERDAAAQAL